MAIISLPTSIGGVTIPGSVVNGPLGPLYSNKFARNDLLYPRDLGSATRGHYIKFNVLEIQPASWEEFKSNSVKYGEQGLAAAGSAFLGLITNPIETIKQTTEGIKNFLADPQSVTKALQYTQREPKPVGSISLYIPDTVNFTYNAQYENTSLATAAQQTPLIKGLLKPGIQALSQNQALKLFLRSQGYAFNPNLQLLFDGINFREYQMAFTFTPYSKQEADTVTKIIAMFKKHSMPRLASGSGGMFFVPPSFFEPKFYFNGQENKKISKVARSVLTSVDVNYSPNGFSSYSDGAPVQTQLTMNFKEVELITREKIEQGY